MANLLDALKRRNNIKVTMLSDTPRVRQEMSLRLRNNSRRNIINVTKHSEDTSNEGHINSES